MMTPGEVVSWRERAAFAAGMQTMKTLDIRVAFSAVTG